MGRGRPKKKQGPPEPPSSSLASQILSLGSTGADSLDNAAPPLNNNDNISSSSSSFNNNNINNRNGNTMDANYSMSQPGGINPIANNNNNNNNNNNINANNMNVNNGGYSNNSNIVNNINNSSGNINNSGSLLAANIASLGTNNNNNNGGAPNNISNNINYNSYGLPSSNNNNINNNNNNNNININSTNSNINISSNSINNSSGIINNNSISNSNNNINSNNGDPNVVDVLESVDTASESRLEHLRAGRTHGAKSDPLFCDPLALRSRMLSIGREQGVPSVSDDAVRVLSAAVQMRLGDVVHRLRSAAAGRSLSARIGAKANSNNNNSSGSSSSNSNYSYNYNNSSSNNNNKAGHKRKTKAKAKNDNNVMSRDETVQVQVTSDVRNALQALREREEAEENRVKKSNADKDNKDVAQSRTMADTNKAAMEALGGVFGMNVSAPPVAPQAETGHHPIEGAADSMADNIVSKMLAGEQRRITVNDLVHVLEGEQHTACSEVLLKTYERL